MPNTPSSNFESLGEEFCWHVRNFACIYGDKYVDTIHLLLAATEVTPVELHGYPELTTTSITKAIEILHLGSASQAPGEHQPQRLSPQAQEIVAKAIGFAATTKRPPSLRDVWVALAMEERGVVPRLLEHLSIQPSELLRRVSGA